MPQMLPPESGVTVRMYRQGHGDCFLLCFKDENDEPFYFLIDCGYKPNSDVHHTIDEVVADIREATGGRIHVVLVTHEHQDHVNGFWETRSGNVSARFEDIEVDHLWLAWTEDPNDDFAEQLREEYNDTLLGLLAARDRLAAAGKDEKTAANRVDELLEFELEGSAEEVKRLLAIDGYNQKFAIKFIKDKTGRTPLYLMPHDQAYWLPRVPGVRIYALGPPRSDFLLADSLDPEPGEGYSEHSLHRNLEARSFYAAAGGGNGSDDGEFFQPFASRHRISSEVVEKCRYAEFFSERYGSEGDEQSWRRIDYDWLQTAEALAMRANREVNNTSLVIAIELPMTGKVILLVGDAQRGSWVSWNDGTWEDVDGNTLTAQDLLGRTVLYKVGHHGSHNATLKGYASSDYANLSWMARGEYSDQFVAMIPANSEWANNSAHWRHPLPSIARALNRKARGRVFQTNIDNVPKPSDGVMSDSEWDEFQNQITETDMFFDYTIPDES